MVKQPPIVLFGICGGIAAYKAAEVVSRLTQAGCETHVAMSAAACQFVTPTTFASLSHRRVLTTMFPPPDQNDGEYLFAHLYPATRADLFVLLPATADMIAKIAVGLADDVVCAAVLALAPGCRRYFCPAMNSVMWSQPVVQANVRRLELAGWIRVGPATGALACGTQGEGRMAEPAEIAAALDAALAESASLAGRRVLILSGPTREHLDPVRFLGNASSGRMGRALADAAAGRGAEVEFVTGPVDEVRLPVPTARVSVYRVVDAESMLRCAQGLAPRADLILYAAAVADYRPAKRSAGKGAKSQQPPALALEPTPDIAATLGAAKRPGQVSIGFALETGEGEAKGRAKLAAKHLDGIVLNGAASMGADAADFRFLAADAPGGAWTPWGRLEKTVCAERILDEAARLLSTRSGGAA